MTDRRKINFINNWYHTIFGQIKLLKFSDSDSNTDGPFWIEQQSFCRFRSLVTFTNMYH